MITLHICLLEELQLNHVRVPILRTILSQPSFLTDLHKTVVNTTTPPENVAEDDGWQLVQPEISPPIDPEGCTFNAKSQEPCQREETH